MKLQDQIDVIQAVIDGRTVTYTSVFTKKVRHDVEEQHSFDFINDTYTVEPLYIEGEVIMVRSHNDLWWPHVFIRMNGYKAFCEHTITGRQHYTEHRKQSPTEKGEA